MTAGPHAPELHRPVDIHDADRRDITVQADAAECRAIAERLGLPALHALTCRLHLQAGPGGRPAAQGQMQARLRQVCVLTLEEFDAAIDAPFTLVFVPSGLAADDLDAEDEDEVEYEGNAIDLGEAAVQQLALMLDPYPRKPGAVLPDSSDAPDNPFAALNALKTRH